MSTATIYGNRSLNWLNKNVPLYWKPVDKVIGPYLLIARQKASIAGTFVWESLLPVRKLVNDYLPPLVARVQDELIPVAIAFLKHFWMTVQNTFSEVSLWLQKNVLTGSLSIENILKVVSETVTQVQAKAVKLFS
jgi:hypothetical protein